MKKSFFAIYNKAREYRQKLMDIEKQRGGQDENGQQKKKPFNKTLALMLDLTKIMKDSGKYPEIQQKHFIKISKMIVDEAKKQTGMQEVNDTVRQSALQLVKNPEQFVVRFRNEQAQGSSQGLTQGSQTNTRTRSGNTGSNDRYNRNNRGRKNFRDDFDNDDNKSNFSNLSDNFSENNRRSKNNYPWKGNDGSFRNYAQSKLWYDKPQWRDNNDANNFTETQRFSGDTQDYFNSPSGSRYYNKEQGNDRYLNRYGTESTNRGSQHGLNDYTVPGDRTGTTNESSRKSSNDRNFGNNSRSRNGLKSDSRNMMENDRRQSRTNDYQYLMDRSRLIY